MVPGDGGDARPGDAKVAENGLAARRADGPLAFDVAAFKAAFRARAAQFGIDPERGATSYQVALVKAAHMRHPGTDWAAYAPLAHGEAQGGRSDWESERFAAAEREARRRKRLPSGAPLDAVPVDMNTARRLWNEVKWEEAVRHLHQLRLPLPPPVVVDAAVHWN